MEIYNLFIYPCITLCNDVKYCASMAFGRFSPIIDGIGSFKTLKIPEIFDYYRFGLSISCLFESGWTLFETYTNMNLFSFHHTVAQDQIQTIDLSIMFLLKLSSLISFQGKTKTLIFWLGILFAFLIYCVYGSIIVSVLVHIW